MPETRSLPNIFTIDTTCLPLLVLMQLFSKVARSQPAKPAWKQNLTQKASIYQFCQPLSKWPTWLTTLALSMTDRWPCLTMSPPSAALPTFSSDSYAWSPVHWPPTMQSWQSRRSLHVAWTIVILCFTVSRTVSFDVCSLFRMRQYRS